MSLEIVCGVERGPGSIYSRFAEENAVAFIHRSRHCRSRWHRHVFGGAVTTTAVLQGGAATVES